MLPKALDLQAPTWQRDDWQGCCCVIQETKTRFKEGCPMKKFVLHFSLATAVTLLTLAIAPSMYAQQSDQDPAPATPQRQAAAQEQNEAQMPQSGDTTTHEAKAFSGRIAKENGELVLQ